MYIVPVNRVSFGEQITETPGTSSTADLAAATPAAPMKKSQPTTQLSPQVFK